MTGFGWGQKLGDRQAPGQPGAQLRPQSGSLPAGDPVWTTEQLGECLIKFQHDNRQPDPQADSHQNPLKSFQKLLTAIFFSLI